MALAEYENIIEWVPGSMNAAADALSRHPSDASFQAVRAILAAVPRAYVGSADVPELLKRYQEDRNHASWRVMIHELGNK